MCPKRVYIRCRFQIPGFIMISLLKTTGFGFFHVHFGDVKNSMVSTHDLPSKWLVSVPNKPHKLYPSYIHMFQWIMILVIKCVCKYIYLCVCVLSINPNCIAQIPITNDLDNDCQIDKWAVFKTTNMRFEHCSNATWFQLSHQKYPIPSLLLY